MVVSYKRRSLHDTEKNHGKASQSTLLILKEAEKHGVAWENIKYTDVYRMQYKKNVQYFYARVPSLTTSFAGHCCRDKNITNNMLQHNGVSVNKSFLLKRTDVKKYYSEVYRHLQKPLVVKPSNSSLGYGVFLNITNKRDYLLAIERVFNEHAKHGTHVLVEEMFTGEEYRILATQKSILSVIKRVPAHVVGDGVLSIERLIEKKNSNTLRESVDTYKKMTLNKKLITYLKDQDLTLAAVLEKGKYVMLYPHSSSDISLGGDTIDMTDRIHPSVKTRVLRAMNSIPGLTLAGIDYMTPDIFSEQTPDIYSVIEINASPAIDWNEFPLQGKRRRVAYEILKIMFPE